MISSVQRADRILDLFSTDVPSWSVTEMAEELRLSKSVVWEYAKTLKHLGILRQDGAGRYRLGWRLFQLGIRSRMVSEISAQARTEIVSLAAHIQETVQLATRHHNEIVFLEKSVPVNGIRINATRVGERLPAHTTASGKMLLSSLTSEELLDLYPTEEMVQRTPGTMKTRSQLAAAIAAAAQNGFAEDNEETFSGIRGIGAPVIDADGDIAWSISVTFYSYKTLDQAEQYRRALIDAAQRLSEFARQADV